MIWRYDSAYVVSLVQVALGYLAEREYAQFWSCHFGHIQFKAKFNHKYITSDWDYSIFFS